VKTSARRGGPSLAALTGRDHALALGFRSRIRELALAEREEYSSAEEYRSALSRRCVCLTLLAGSGSRWVKSLEDARSPFDPAKPRGLYPVLDFIRCKGGSVPIATYAFAAVRGLGRHLVVVRGWEAEIDSEILKPLGIGAEERGFFTQGCLYEKPLGHGDAAWQARELWKGAEYLIANFGGDPNSSLTALSSLLALDALNAKSATGSPDIDLLIPAARVEGAAYPIILDDEGLPRAFGHSKLGLGEGPASSSYSNVGLRIYRTAALRQKLELFRSRYWVEGRGYAVPGNDPAGAELALDNVDAALAAEGRARILAVARPEELSPVKSLEDIPAFEEAMASVIAEDAAAAPTARSGSFFPCEA
jgi:hypothetical protein